MRKTVILAVFLFLINPYITAYAATHVVNKKESDYSFDYSEKISTSHQEYFLINGSRDMEININVHVISVANPDDRLRIYLVEGRYEMPEGITEPENFDEWHSHPEPTTNFHTRFIMVHKTQYTLVVIPNGSSYFSVEISGYNDTSSFGEGMTICLLLILVSVAVLLAYFKIHGVIGAPRPARSTRRKRKESDQKEDAPYEIR